ncbi:MAG: glycosyl hydrolase 53 family protein, partial [Bacteroidaceae bacterium]|nr:glycosyl hydrolase 53 family protein [Bacteroidaceae bacterium]
MSFKYNASKVTIAGTEYETSAIDSITFDAPATMKFRGGDVSLLSRYEENGANYMDVNGTKITNMLAYLKQLGWNALRVRLFVNPSQASTADKGQGVCQNLDYVIALGKRIKRAGFQFLLDFHYSDSWADPAKQFTPAAWSSLSANELYTKIYDYTKDALQQLVAADATPDFIQTGNEISYGM